MTDKPDSRIRTIGRLMKYLLRYRVRIGAGVGLSLLVSFTNLFSLSAFVPIFNAMGETGPVKIFDIGDLSRYRRLESGQSLSAGDAMQARWTSFKIWANSKVENKTSSEAILLLCMIAMPVYLLKLFAVTGTIYCIGTAGLMAIRDIRLQLYAKLNYLDLDYFSRQRSGFIMSRIINDVEFIGRSLSLEFTDGINNLFYVITHLTLMAVIDWKLLVTVLFGVPLLLSPVSKFAARVRKAAAGQQERLAEMGGHIQEIISGIRVIRAFSMERFEKQRFDVINHTLFQNTFRGHYFHQVGPAITEFVGTVAILGFIAWGAFSISKMNLDRGLFFLFFFLLIFIMRPLKQLSIMVNLLTTAAAAAVRVFGVLDSEEGVREEKNPVSFKKLKKEIKYKGVGYRYPEADSYAIKDIELTVSCGKTVSLVGSSGAGKSTLMDLLARFYDVTEGSIEIDGVDIKKYNLKELRRSTGIVSQNVFLFNATVRENIAYGMLDCSQERVREVAEAANAHEFIMALPEGYETRIGERGVMLSGGQRQRIAIARALLLDPPVLIFDEATSSLDNESERLVQQAMDRLLTGRTVFIIAHRLSTVYRSDEIIVLDKGRIVERGTHQELLDEGKIYKKLYDMQFSN